MTNPLPPPVLSIEELTAALSESLARERKLRAELANLRGAVNRWQMLFRGPIGSMENTLGEVQRYLRDGKLPE